MDGLQRETARDSVPLPETPGGATVEGGLFRSLMDPNVAVRGHCTLPHCYATA